MTASGASVMAQQRLQVAGVSGASDQSHCQKLSTVEQTDIAKFKFDSSWKSRDSKLLCINA